MTRTSERLDPPVKQILLMATLSTIVLAPCLLTFFTGNRLFLIAWPLTIWAAIFVVDLTEPSRPSPPDNSTGAPKPFVPKLGGTEPFAEFRAAIRARNA